MYLHRDLILLACALCVTSNMVMTPKLLVFQIIEYIYIYIYIDDMLFAAFECYDLWTFHDIERRWADLKHMDKTWVHLNRLVLI